MTTVLLDKFNSLIEKYGGMDKLADDIEKEWLKITVRRNLVPENRKRDYARLELIFIADNYETQTADWIASQLKRSVYSVRTKIYRLQQKLILKKAI